METLFEEISIRYPQLKRSFEPFVSSRDFYFDSAFFEGVIKSNATPNVIYVHDLVEEKYFFPNNRLEEVLGYEKNALNPMSKKLLMKLMHPDDAAKYDHFIRTVSKSKNRTFLESEYRLLTRDGSWRWFLSKEIIYKWERQNNVTHIFGIATDITNLKSTEAKIRDSNARLLMAEKKFRDIFENSPDAIYVEDSSGTILDVNQAAILMQNLPKENLIGLNIRHLVPREKFVKILTDYKRLFFGVVKTIESAVWNTAGREIPVEISGKKISYGNKEALLLQVRDVSERKKMEAERAEIAREKSRRKEEMIKASLNVQEEERKRIAAEMHDEIGAGLSKISVLGQVIKKSFEDTGIVSCNIEKILQASQEVQENISEIIWAMDPKNDTLENLLAYINYYASEYLEASTLTHQIVLPEKIPSITLVGKIRRNIFLIIKESLNNIVKHAGASEARVEITFDNNDLLISIRDNGKGFNAVSIPRFKNGISNMKRRISEVNGRINITSKPGEGSIIQLSIPLQSAATVLRILQL